MQVSVMLVKQKYACCTGTAPCRLGKSFGRQFVSVFLKGLEMKDRIDQQGVGKDEIKAMMAVLIGRRCRSVWKAGAALKLTCCAGNSLAGSTSAGSTSTVLAGQDCVQRSQTG